MRVVIDCFKLVKGVGKSIGIYNVALNLTKNLVRGQKEFDNGIIKNCELIVLGNSINKQDFDTDGLKFIEIKKYDPLNRVHCILWELFAVSIVCKKLHADRIIFPRGYCALTHPVKDIVIIHDLIPFYYSKYFPGVFNKIENIYIMNRLRASAKSCNQIITISESSKQDILKYCDVVEDKISVIYNACSRIDFNEYKEKKKNSYICAITSSLPHKNAKGILESYNKYCELADDPLNLIVIGIENVSTCNLPQNVKSKITCYKYIKDNKKLYKLIANSEIFLFLSLIEGFGLPPVEAMQLNVPVICSNTSSLPEIVGNAAVLVNPTNYYEVAVQLKYLTDSAEKRNKLIQLGEKNYKRFSWRDVSEKYWKVITSG